MVICSHLCKRDGEVEEQPELGHLDVRGLWQGIRYTDEPEKEKTVERLEEVKMS